MVEGGKCEFENCSHIGVQGCAVKDGWERYPYYLQLLEEIRIEEESQLKKYGTKKEGDTRYCSILLKQTALFSYWSHMWINQGSLVTVASWERRV